MILKLQARNPYPDSDHTTVLAIMYSFCQARRRRAAFPAKKKKKKRQKVKVIKNRANVKSVEKMVRIQTK
jgi:hypothetical protein